jgi:hypothetical protein
MIAIYKRLGLTKEEFVSLIEKKYWKENLSQASIANDIGCHPTSIENVFRQGLVKSRTLSESSRNAKKRCCEITEKQQDIFNGMMLSDFHIEKGAFQARLTFGFKHLDFANFCIEQLNCFDWSTPTQSTITNCWHSKSKFYERLMDYHNIWYSDRKKIVPNIKITPATLLFWYLGDGMSTRYGVLLCSESFSREENQILSDKITELGIKNHVTPNNRIRLSGNKGKQQLLSIIGDGSIECYKYKFL